MNGYLKRTKLHGTVQDAEELYLLAMEEEYRLSLEKEYWDRLYDQLRWEMHMEEERRGGLR